MKKLYDDDLMDNDDETVTIPDFVEDKTETKTSMTDSTSVDMSIFKMSDDELYDDDDPDDDDSVLEPRKKGSGATITLCLILIFLLLATAGAAVYYALKQRTAYQDANTKYLQLQANQEAFQKQLAEKDALIEELNKQIEELKNATPAVTGSRYVVTDGPLTFRVTPTFDSETTTYEGKSSAQNGETYTVLEVIDDQYDEGRRWAKIAEDVYFQIGYMDAVWAEPVN